MRPHGLLTPKALRQSDGYQKREVLWQLYVRLSRGPSASRAFWQIQVLRRHKSADYSQIVPRGCSRCCSTQRLQFTTKTFDWNLERAASPALFNCALALRQRLGMNFENDAVTSGVNNFHQRNRELHGEPIY